jgi:hypothetical protein
MVSEQGRAGFSTQATEVRDRSREAVVRAGADVACAPLLRVGTQVGEELILVRHYSGQWFPSGLPAAETIQLPLPAAQLDAMRREIAATGFVPQVYGTSEIR